MDRQELKQEVIKVWGAVHGEDEAGAFYKLPGNKEIRQRLGSLLG